MTQTTTRHIDTKDVAKMIRRDLKVAFPATAFSVRIDRYSGGSSIDIRWTDGPTSAAVEAITGRYRGKGLVDNTDYAPERYAQVDGETVRYGSDYVMCARSFSVAFAQKVADEVADRYGVQWVTVGAGWDGHADWSSAWNIKIDAWTNLQDAIWRVISAREAR